MSPSNDVLVPTEFFPAQVVRFLLGVRVHILSPVIPGNHRLTDLTPTSIGLVLGARFAPNLVHGEQVRIMLEHPGSLFQARVVCTAGEAIEDGCWVEQRLHVADPDVFLHSLPFILSAVINRRAAPRRLLGAERAPTIDIEGHDQPARLVDVSRTGVGFELSAHDHSWEPGAVLRLAVRGRDLPVRAHLWARVHRRIRTATGTRYGCAVVRAESPGFHELHARLSA